MSRTFRRTRKNAIHQHLGTFGEFKGYWWMQQTADRKGMALRELFDLHTRQFHMDRDNEGRRNPPRWWRREFGAKRVRIANKRMLQRHLECDTFDMHSPEPFVNRYFVTFWL